MSNLGIAGITNAERIGSGGFATVYRADQTAFRRSVAVKVLNTKDLDDLARSRFERECQALGLLSGHRGTVTVYDGGFTGDGHPYLVMEYMPGGSFKDKLVAEGPIGWEEAARVGAAVARSLQAAHDAGIIHRDIKPGNILIDRFGEPRLGDFGIARVAGSDETKSGVVTTSVAHAPPEVLDRKRPGPRSDIYSLASTLYELATGRAPYVDPDDESMMATMSRILMAPVPDLRAEGAPEAVAAALERGLAKDPGARFGSAADLAAALEGQPLDEDDTRDVVGLPPVPVATPPPEPDQAEVPPEIPPDEEPEDATNLVTTPPPPVPGTALPLTEDRDERPSDRRGRGRWWLVALAVLVVLALGAGVVLTQDGGSTADPEVTPVPDVVGQGLDSAEAELRNADFDVEIREEASGEVDEGAVISQDPPGGEEAEAGSLVTVVVSTGPEQVEVPDLAGLTAVEALAALTDAGLEVTREEEASDTVAEGDVISQDPEAGTAVDAGSAVTVVVSTGSSGDGDTGSTTGGGPTAVTVPEVIGLFETEAVAAIEAAGLTATVIQDFSGAGELGRVLSANPPGGSQLLPGTNVAITVASLPGE